MSPALLYVVAAAGLLAPLDEGALELRYNGSLEKVARQQEPMAVKRFSLYALLSGAEGQRSLAFVLDERGGGSWAWPERYGRKPLDKDLAIQDAPPFRLLHEHDGTPNKIALVSPIFAGWLRLKANATWNEGRDTWTVTGTQPVQERKCWTVEVSTGFGRKRTLWVDQELPIVVALEERVFLGQGEEHTLKMQLSSQRTLTADEFAKHDTPLQALLALQTALGRQDEDALSELTAEQVQKTAEVVGDLEKASADTPFSGLVTAISRDVKAQQARTSEVSRLAGRFVGQTAPAFKLETLEKKPLDDAARKDKVTVLHFWEYQNDPLIEPYGQAGYLDHIYSKRKKLGVEVIGVAVDSRLADPATQTAGVRSAQKFKGFMNLSFPVAADDGTVIGKFGDPRKAGAKLPLWVVIGADGKIVHYSVGFYKVNPDEGLRELDEVLIEAVKTARGK